MPDLIKNQCRAKAKSTGERCQRSPVAGAAVCRVHGGASQHVKAAARRRLEVQAVQADMMSVIASEGLQGVTDPLEALARLATEALAMKSALAARVNALQQLSHMSPVGEQIKAEVLLYERAIDRSAKFLDVLAKSGFEERRVRLAEDQGNLVHEVIMAIFQRLELTESQWGLARVAAPEELRRLGDG